MVQKNKKPPFKKGDTQKIRHLNFVVRPEVYYEFKELAARKRLGMRELFFACFDAYKSAYGSTQHERPRPTDSNKIQAILSDGQSKARAPLREKLLHISRVWELPLWRQLLRGFRRLP